MNGGKLSKKIKSIFKIVGTPKCWIRIYSTSRSLDQKIRDLINKRDQYLVKTDGYFVYLFNKQSKKPVYAFWVENKWYSYLHCGYIYNANSRPTYINFDSVPSRQTCFDFYEAFEKECSLLKEVDPVEKFWSIVEENPYD